MNQSPHPTRSATTARRRTAARVVAVAALSAGLLTGIGGGAVSAGMSDEAIVVCNGAYNTIEVTPRVVSDWPDHDQWTATKIWTARWNGSAWSWTSTDWNIELASRTNTPIAVDISLLEKRTLNKSDGYYYVYVQSFMWNGSEWYGGTGRYTTTYTQITPSVSHEPATRTTATYCTL